MAEWVKRDHSKGTIDRSGQILIPWWTDLNVHMDQRLLDAYKVVENWRTCHGLPLNVVQAVLRGRAQRVQPKAIVAQRLKRFESIMNKLVREPTMKLSQMQDLGGCRAILSDVSAVRRLLERYRGERSLLSEETSVKCNDYISDPKDDGYRGVHVVARYHPRQEKRGPWEGQRIEIQLRTNLQHAFATAVETVTTFTAEPLKFGAGSNEWRRFFSLMGSALAMREGTPRIAGTPDSQQQLIAELRHLSSELRVRQRLRTWANSIRTMRRKNIAGFKWLLLVLDTEKNTIQVTGFSDGKLASEALAKIEPSTRKNLDAVLVWVNSIRQLRAAYPNYYADTGEFLNALTAALSPSQKPGATERA
jgi:Region found in RelA / SpoT proteins